MGRSDLDSDIQAPFQLLTIKRGLGQRLVSKLELNPRNHAHLFKFKAERFSKSDYMSYMFDESGMHVRSVILMPTRKRKCPRVGFHHFKVGQKVLVLPGEVIRQISPIVVIQWMTTVEKHGVDPTRSSQYLSNTDDKALRGC